MRQRLKDWEPKPPLHFELSVEDVKKVGVELAEFVTWFHPAFGRRESREKFDLYVKGLLSRTERKNMEAMAIALESPEEVRNLQRFMSQDKWDEPRMRKRHLELAAQRVNDPQGVWSIDSSEISKKGKESVGVGPQYCGSLGKVANGQSGVFICYSSDRGHALLDGRLYLPKRWFEKSYQERWKRCRIPEGTSFKTKLELARELFEELRKSQPFDGNWVTCDCTFGNDDEFLEALGKELLYLAEIPCTRKVWVKKAAGHPELESEGCTVEELLNVNGLLHWYPRKISEGTKGPIVADFARIRVYLSADRNPASERWLLVRNDSNQKVKYALSNAPERTPLRELVRVSGLRWPIERCFQEGKSELGMDHYEHRSWPAWHRHMRLVFLAQLFLLGLQIKYKEKAPALTLQQARRLLEGSFPSLDKDPNYRLRVSRYYGERNDQAYRSHRKRTMARLAKWKSLKRSRKRKR